MWFILITIGLSALLGFYLAFNFFFRLSLKPAWRWLGVVVGGLITAVLFAVTAFMVIWPPINWATTILGLAVAGVVTAAALYGTNVKKEVASHDDLDGYNFDINSRTGS